MGEIFFTKKIEIFAIFRYLSPYFYTDNFKILLKRTDRLRNPSKKQIFVKIGGCDAYWFPVTIVIIITIIISTAM